MNKYKLAGIISTVLYPAITGTVFTFILYLSLMGLNIKTFLVATIYSALIALVPFLIIRLLMQRGKISDQDITRKEERKIYYQTAFPAYIAALLFLLLVGVPKIVFLMGVGVMIFVIIHYLVSPIYKISVHVGGLTFDIIAMGLILSKDFYFLLPLVPLLVWSRYHIKKHTFGESLLGALIGGGIPVVLFKLFS